MFTFCYVQVLETPILYEVDDEGDCSPECEYQRQPSQQGSCPSALEEACKKAGSEYYTALNVKSGPQKWGTGFQPTLVCMLPWIRGETPGHMTSLSVNSTYNLYVTVPFFAFILHSVCLVVAAESFLWNLHIFSRNCACYYTPGKSLFRMHYALFRTILPSTSCKALTCL